MEEALIKRIPPHSLEAEQSVIGAMLLDRDAILVASEILTSDDFYQNQYGIIFDAMVELCNEGKPVDTITLQNRLKEKELSAFRNKHVGFVFQFHQLLPEFTALENVMIPALIAGTSSKEATARALEILSFMGLAERASHKPNELSGGEKQRVAVSRALINNPAVILADEPSGSLDTHNKEELHQLFFKLRDQLGQTFVIVTHDESLARITDRTVHIIDGIINNC